MECQYGPRRKGNLLKRGAEDLVVMKGEYKQTCPARYDRTHYHIYMIMRQIFHRNIDPYYIEDRDFLAPF